MGTSDHRIFVVYARAAAGLRQWPIAAFFNSPDAEAAAREFAAAAVREARPLRPAGADTTVVSADVRGYVSWADVPSLSKGL